MRSELRRLGRSSWFTLLLCVAYGLLMIPLAPGFASIANLQNVLFAMLPLLVVATGQTVVMITAGIDLSATSIIAVTSVIGAMVMTSDDGWLAGSVAAVPIAIVVMLSTAMLLGCVNGVCVAWLKMPAFIVTLTSGMLLSGLAVWSTGSDSIYNLPTAFRLIGQNLLSLVAFTLVVVLSTQWMLSRTVLGCQLHAIGGNAATARVSGVPMAGVLIAAYAIGGLCAGVGSVLITSQLETGSPVQWENNLLDVIGATVIGGTSLFGGRGHVFWTAGGVLLLTLIDNSLYLMNLSFFTIMMAKGLVIVLAALLDVWRQPS